MFSAEKLFGEISRKFSGGPLAIKRRSRGDVAVVALTLALGGSAGAATLNVPASYSTIQAAVTASNSGDTIIVADGTYTGVGNVDVDFGGKNINVQSAHGSAATTIDCQGTSGSPHRAFYIHSGETGAVIQGFTIQNGYIASGFDDGAGIAVVGSTATIRQCMVQNCTSVGGGGGVSVIYQGSTVANATITACTFYNNASDDGGGVFVDGSNVGITQCAFLSNSCQTFGGAVQFDRTNMASITDSITDCTFVSNSALSEGGAIDITASDGSLTANVFNSSFYNNAISTAGAGTIDFYNSTSTVRNCIFYGDVSSKEISTANPPAAGVVQYCDVHQSGYAGTNHNINSDPLYSDPTNGDLHLQSGSPCIAAGTSTGAPSVDYDSLAWVGNVSIGAFRGNVALPATHFSVSAPTSATAGSSVSVTVTALDSGGSTVTGYTGTVHFTSTDGLAALPADATLTNGVGTFNLTLKTAGSQTVTATDTVTSSINGTSAAITVSAGAASHFVITAPSSMTAGSAISVTVSAVDAYGNVSTGYSGTVHFTSSDAQAVLPANATLTNGVGSFNVTLKTAGTYSITATDTVTPSITGDTPFISVNAAAASYFVIASAGSMTAGSAISVTVTTRDAYGNVSTGYSGTVHFTSSDAQAILPANATLTNGMGTFNVTLKTAGSQSITATDTINPSITGARAGIIVSAAAANHFVVAAPSSAVAGSAISVTVNAVDAYGNVSTGYSGTVHFTSSDPQAVLPANATLTNGMGTFSVSLGTAGSQSITATDTVNSSVTGTASGISVSSAAASHFVVSAPASTTAGASLTFSLTALDAYGNIATGYSGTVHFTSSDNNALLPGDSTLTNGAGSFTAVLATVGNQTITGTDTVNSAVAGTSSAIAVSVGAATHFVLTAHGSVRAGAPFAFSVIAHDAFGNTATGYSGTVHFTSTDAHAALPTDLMLVNGIGNVQAVLKTTGNQTITATDTVAGISGTSSVIAVIAAATTKFVVTAHGSVRAGAGFAFSAIAQDAYGNATPGYTGAVHFTSTDVQAVLPANITLINGVGSVTAALKTAGNQTITATDTVSRSIMGVSSAITVIGGATTKFVITAHGSVRAGAGFAFSAIAQDAYGNATPGYTGTVHFTSTDPKAVLPANTTLVNGVVSVTAALNTVGAQTVSATDTINRSITGVSSAVTVIAIH